MATQTRRVLRVCKAACTRNFNELQKLIDKEADVEAIDVRLKTLEINSEKLIKALEDVVNELMEDESSTIEQIDRENQVIDEQRERVEDMKNLVLKLKKKCAVETAVAKVVDTSLDSERGQAGTDVAGESLAGTGLPAGTSQVASKIPEQVYCRPKLKVPELAHFSGRCVDWIPFWGRFSVIHDATDLSVEDKFYYLLQAIERNSEAEDLIKRYAPTGVNYPLAVQALKARFGRADVQVEIHMRKLLDILWKCKSQGVQKVSRLYDAIQGQMSTLATLHITAARYGPLLYPMVESCLPVNLLELWQRSVEYRSTNNPQEEDTYDTFNRRLELLMEFLESEANGELHRRVTREGFGIGAPKENTRDRGVRLNRDQRTPTAAALFANGARCVFCEGKHDSKTCANALKLSHEDRVKKVQAGRLCFKCLNVGHMSRQCNVNLKCETCGDSHVDVMCYKSKESVPSNFQAYSNPSAPNIFFQTARVLATFGDKKKEVRVLFDSGSHRSYVLEELALEMGLVPSHNEDFPHALFGGAVTKNQNHPVYWVELGSENNKHKIQVLGQKRITNRLPNVSWGPWIQELALVGIYLSDVGNNDPVDILLGADVVGNLITGKQHKLKCADLVAIETRIGWTLMGKADASREDPAAVTYSTYFSEGSIKSLWELDVLGIEDPKQVVSKLEAATAAKESFTSTVGVDETGRYEVCLPWLIDRALLHTNRKMAEKRLDATMAKLKKQNMVSAYNDVFLEWEREGIIEVASTETVGTLHYLPHRPVIREDSKTTKIRPVFDASAREKGQASLNDCLEKGPNLIELIPVMLLRFRLFKIGIVSDIKKAFLQIGIKPKDRDVLRFLWKDENDITFEYRHRRVVFGVNCSPFMLGATIQHHLKYCLEKVTTDSEYSKQTVELLSNSFYVDNCITSVSTLHAAKDFQHEAQKVMNEGCFELRGWEFSGKYDGDEHESVLGLLWNKKLDSLWLNPKCLTMELKEDVTKRTILASAQSVYDPLGLISPVTLAPKLLLQQLWKKPDIGWDTVLDDETRDQFHNWQRQLLIFKGWSVPRWIQGSPSATYSLHIFCDASASAYAAVVYLRVKEINDVKVNLIMAKTRIAPLSNISIPRLELMSATIASRLFKTVSTSLNIEANVYCWSDSTTVLAWIKRVEPWAPFVGNRVREIRENTCAMWWRHVPGNLNPADRPSRGCSAQGLLDSEWWEGPAWLREDEDKWPLVLETTDEETVASERKRMLVCSMADFPNSDQFHLHYFSSFRRSVRMIGWLLRFIYNCRHPSNRRKSELEIIELEEAERFIWKQVQQAAFQGVEDECIRSLTPFLDQHGIIRLESRISNRADLTDFRYPVILPQNDAITHRMLYELHTKRMHVGTSGLLAASRDKFWVLGGRRTMRQVIRKCMVCKRFSSRPGVTRVLPLPEDRVRDVVPFEIVGVDFAGPLIARDGGKCYICIFTCAVYRAVHLELTGSLSSAGFVQVLRRYIARRGRPTCIYSDNGTNFKGLVNIFNKMKWDKVVEFVKEARINWYFNPPAASWWGGFWERLIGLLKQLLRKVLAKASLTYEELLTIIYDCEDVLNNRPLTYITEDHRDLIALTPNMFLREIATGSTPDCDLAESKFLGRRARYLHTVRDALRHRFRSEYLGQLLLRQPRRLSKPLQRGQLVLIGENSPRVGWQLGRVSELKFGKDGVARTAQVRTSRGELTRPVQKLYSLECDNDEDSSTQNNDADRNSNEYNSLRTRYGRIIRQPQRFGV